MRRASPAVFSVHTATGDITLAQGQTLTSGSVNLTADGGSVIIAGTIDTSGINGGDIAVYGRGVDDQSGVTLTDSARIYAYANGYAADDTRQAKGGNVTLGTDFVSLTTNTDGSISGTSGKINVAAGVVIDVSAKRPGDRLVPFVSNGTKYYNYVQGDQGGTVTLRAPVRDDNTVNATVGNASSIVGASAINLVGFKRWDLAQVAASGLYSGVYTGTLPDGTIIPPNTVVLDVTQGLDTADNDGNLVAVAGVNFLGDKGPPDGSAPTLVDFVQKFDISASYASGGGLHDLSMQSNFHAQPGMDLTYTGNITLASNWNLGAGIVNQNAAVAHGAMVFDSALGKNDVVSGMEAYLLQHFTEMLYHIGGNIAGEPAC